MKTRRAVLIAFLTVVFAMLGVIADAKIDPHNSLWRTFASVLNFPSFVILFLVGPGHGFTHWCCPL